MCLNPGFLTDPHGFRRKIRCRKCAQCISDQVRDWSGRAFAEQLHSDGSIFLTCTYGYEKTYGKATVEGQRRHAEGAYSLMYTHVQLYLKRLRRGWNWPDTKGRIINRVYPYGSPKNHYEVVYGDDGHAYCEQIAPGYKVRYVVAGEYGSLKGRAHWHFLLFFTGRVPSRPPEIPDGRVMNDPFWDRGHTYWKKMHMGHCRYVAKYVTGKDNRDPYAQTIIRMSRIPVLGAKYFDARALQMAKQGLHLRDRKYRIPGSYVPKTQKLWEYYMGDGTLRYYTQRYIHHWGVLYGEDPPSTDIVQKYFDKNWNNVHPYGDKRNHYDVFWNENGIAFCKLAKPDVRLKGELQSKHRPVPPGMPCERKISAIGKEYEEPSRVYFDEKRHAYYTYPGFFDETGTWREFRERGLHWWSFNEQGERCWHRELVTEREGRERAQAHLYGKALPSSKPVSRARQLERTFIRDLRLGHPWKPPVEGGGDCPF